MEPVHHYTEVIRRDATTVGVLVPPDNPTVEPELRRLLPADVRVKAVHFPHADGDLKDRLLGYNAALRKPEVLSSLRGASVTYFACTGSSYLVGQEGDRQLNSALDTSGVGTSMTAARAIIETLRNLDRRDISLVSPYPDWLTKAAVSFWEESGIRVVSVTKMPAPHGIYAISPQDVVEAVRTLKPPSTSAVLLSGTGMPTISAIEQLRDELAVPVVSSTFAAAQRVLHLLGLQGATG